ncbi:MAG TPA: hypothetical protein VN372_14685 [Methanospirillum sp.]|nr:hypothetical protein [Methanospirillum sp.]
MIKIWHTIIFVSLLSGSLLTAGCTSVFNTEDLTFLTSLQEFQNESVTRISHINEDAKMKQWDTVKTDLRDYQGIITTEIDHLNSLQVSEKVIPIREKAVIALKKQDVILQAALDLPELNASVIPDLAGDYLSSIIESAIASALSGKE